MRRAGPRRPKSRPARPRGPATLLAVLAVAGCGTTPAAPRPASDAATAAATASPPAAAAAPRHGSAVVWAVGDGAGAGSGAPGVVARIARGRIDRLLYLGDVYDAGTADEFSRSYAPTYGRFARITSPTPGNHEWPQRSVGYDPYWRRVTGHTPRPYYALHAGGWQLLSLNSEAPHAPGSPQVRWLRRTVRGPGTCRIAFWHRPRFSAGLVHGDAPDVQPLWAALRGHARIVLTGHEHDMQRFAPRNGITEFVSGAGGRSHYALQPRTGLAFGDDTHFGALRLALRPGRADWAFVTDEGRTLASGTIRCVSR